jgi:hypothetical protein
MTPLQERAQEKKNLIIAYQKVFNTDEGVKVMENLNRLCFFKRGTSGHAPEATAENNGKREVILHIHQYLDADLREEVQTHA